MLFTVLSHFALKGANLIKMTTKAEFPPQKNVCVSHRIKPDAQPPESAGLCGRAAALTPLFVRRCHVVGGVGGASIHTYLY